MPTVMVFIIAKYQIASVTYDNRKLLGDIMVILLLGFVIESGIHHS